VNNNNNAVLIQQVYPNAGMESALALTNERHTNYCKNHLFDFRSVCSNVVQGWSLTQGGWAKVALMRVAVQYGYTFVVWLDADTVIKDLTTDLRMGCPANGVGAVRFRYNTFAPHWNVGALYIRVSSLPDLEHFFDLWIKGYPGPEDQREQGVLNALGTEYITTIDDKWNYVPNRCDPVDAPVVLGFHSTRGVSNKMKAMIEALQ